jgi:phosphatidylglycerol---prolipoprotein diacylglyceryl transferase
MLLTGKQAKRAGTPEAGLDAVFAALAIAFLVSGRLLYAVEHLTAFTQNPISLVSLNASLFDAGGAAVCAAIAALNVMQARRMNIWATLDLLTPFLAVMAVGIGLAHLASGAAFGSETRLPWAIELWGAMRHPTQIYESLTALVVFGIIWFGGTYRTAGHKFMLFVALSAGSRLIIEAFRGDSTLVLGGLRMAQILALLVLVGALAGLELLRQGSTAEDGGAGRRPEDMAR